MHFEVYYLTHFFPLGLRITSLETPNLLIANRIEYSVIDSTDSITGLTNHPPTHARTSIPANDTEDNPT